MEQCLSKRSNIQLSLFKLTGLYNPHTKKIVRSLFHDKKYYKAHYVTFAFGGLNMLELDF